MCIIFNAWQYQWYWCLRLKTFIWEKPNSLGYARKQHMKDVQQKILSNAIPNHIVETWHTMNWDEAKLLGFEKRLYQWKSLESFHIAKCKRNCLNQSDVIYISKWYSKGETSWLEEGRNKKRRDRAVDRAVLI